MKQKVVIKVTLNGHKSRSKAMKISVVSGVESLTFKGKEMDELEIVGEGIDAVDLTSLLRKYLGHAELVSVASAEKKEEKKEENIPHPIEYAFPYYPIYPHFTYTLA